MAKNFARSRKSNYSNNGALTQMSNRIVADLEAFEAKLRFIGHLEMAEDTRWALIFMEKVANTFTKKTVKRPPV